MFIFVFFSVRPDHRSHLKVEVHLSTVHPKKKRWKKNMEDQEPVQNQKINHLGQDPRPKKKRLKDREPVLIAVKVPFQKW